MQHFVKLLGSQIIFREDSVLTIIHKGSVVLETERLILRRFTIDDLEPVFYNCWSKPEVWQWTNYKPMKTTEDVVKTAEMFTEDWLGAYSRPNRYSWAIQLKASGDVIGRFFGMYPEDRLKQIELAYEIGPDWWNQGYMTEAVKRVLDYFFREIGFNRVYAYHAHENPASGRVMQKCGMLYEGTMRQACLCNRGIFDKVNYAILAEDYFGRQKMGKDG